MLNFLLWILVISFNVSINESCLTSDCKISSIKQDNMDVVQINRAICYLDGSYSGNKVKGYVLMEDKGSSVEFLGNISGLSFNTKHGFHIHQYGDLGNKCKMAGGHYNPHNKRHGGPSSAERHVGDLGNVQSNGAGFVSINKKSDLVKLNGHYSVMGRSIVLHEKADDLVSQPTGNAGARLACCVIGIRSK